MSEADHVRDAVHTRDDRDVYIGLMSGTSLDGISSAAVTFAEHGARIVPTLLAQAHRPFDPYERTRLLEAMQQGTARDYCRLSVDLAHWLADAAELAITASGVSRDRVRAVISHGQTLWHEPGHSTWQLGQPAVIAERLDIDVISDVRARDVAAGGQGAPLVSVADALCFAHDTGWRVLQNLGGIGNLTIVPPAGHHEPPVAFDTGPGVVILDGIVRSLVPSLLYDVDGVLAGQGTVIESVVHDALAHAYFAGAPPKSTGRELFTPAYIAQFVNDCRAAHPEATVADMLATAVAFTAESIADQVSRFVTVPTAPIEDFIVAGGGAENPVLLSAIQAALQKRLGERAPAVRRFSDVFFDGNAKECVAFALIGWLHVHGRDGNVASATGANGGRVLGSLTPSSRPRASRTLESRATGASA